ncbi:MAG: FCD domain-containing protein [Actinomycetota bacterium]|nr:FCD domain-containing protein [Actinomycetota bacterium]
MRADDDGDDDATAGTQLHHPRLAEIVAGQLRERIVLGELVDGSRLPKQDDLLREFRVSRQSLREALRILESEGLLSIQRGNVGGAIVRAPRAQSSAYMFGLVMRSRHVALGDLAEAIRAVEPVAASLCARRADRMQAVVPELRRLHEGARVSTGDGVELTGWARRFHEVMVQLCGNETLILMLGTLELMWSHQEQAWAEQAEQKGRYPAGPARQDVLSAHAAILKAIERGDEDRAARLARDHLRASQRYALAEGGATVVHAVPPRETPDRGLS